MRIAAFDQNAGRDHRVTVATDGMAQHLAIGAKLQARGRASTVANS